jgi:glycine/serine hydroxymethyltransferase
VARIVGKLTGSARKTFSGPQGGVIVWDDSALTVPLTQAIFTTLAATHQVYRVAALAVSAAEMIAFGTTSMARIVENARALAVALHRRGIPELGAHKGFTCTHQVIADGRQFGGGMAAYPLHEPSSSQARPESRRPGRCALDAQPSGMRQTRPCIRNQRSMTCLKPAELSFSSARPVGVFVSYRH